MNPDSAADKAPASAFTLASVKKARIPDKRYRHRAAILEPYGKLVFRHFDVHGAGANDITR
jgi:hypothetical protein